EAVRMIDVAVVGSAFLDLTFEGLEALPGPGQERFSRELHATPGGAAITAVGLARLGLSVGLVAPLGRALPGALLRERLDAEGIVCAGPEVERTAVTAGLPIGDERAMVTFEPPAAPTKSLVELLAPRAVVAGIHRLDLVPRGALA